MSDRRLKRLGTTKLVRNNASYTRQRAEFKARCKARNLPCGICHGELGPIDYDAEPQTSQAFELDHIKPVETHPDLYYMQTNWQPSHVACNRSVQSKKGKKARNAKPKSEQWVKPKW